MAVSPSPHWGSLEGEPSRKASVRETRDEEMEGGREEEEGGEKLVQGYRSAGAMRGGEDTTTTIYPI